MTERSFETWTKERATLLSSRLCTSCWFLADVLVMALKALCAGLSTLLFANTKSLVFLTDPPDEKRCFLDTASASQAAAIELEPNVNILAYDSFSCQPEGVTGIREKAHLRYLCACCDLFMLTPLLLFCLCLASFSRELVQVFGTVSLHMWGRLACGTQTESAHTGTGTTHLSVWLSVSSTAPCGPPTISYGFGVRGAGEGFTRGAVVTWLPLKTDCLLYHHSHRHDHHRYHHRPHHH